MEALLVCKEIPPEVRVNEPSMDALAPTTVTDLLLTDCS